ncbi:Mss4-like protein [Dactylonectria estremocensis]|uniref:Mss4-like protein n=1 Tax=Dactylonectria estremocensis TaxID=1079267 RepID=A0A9P9F107_9HYPO|nr:Mss4-like protein [Dactylonectria estremocensis]
MTTIDESKPSQTYEAGCHCGFISLSVTLSPPFPELKVTHCNCSICRRAGYLLVYRSRDQVTWHHGSDTRVGRYQFNTKTRDHMFCPKCGASIGIDFWNEDPKEYGISVRQFNDIDLDALNYMQFDGAHRMSPAGDLSGKQVNAETGEEPSSST